VTTPFPAEALAEAEAAAAKRFEGDPVDLRIPDNAQLSLLTGMAAADLMLRGGAGLLRTLPPAEPEALERPEEYAHVTAPLRRLADRYATECALAAFAGEPVPAWVRDRLEAPRHGYRPLRCLITRICREVT